MDDFVDSAVEQMAQDTRLSHLALSDADKEVVAEWMRTVWLAAQGKKFGVDAEPYD